MGTVITIIIVLSIVGLIIHGMIKDKKKGKSSCGCNCGCCANSSLCHSNKNK